VPKEYHWRLKKPNPALLAENEIIGPHGGILEFDISIRR